MLKRHPYLKRWIPIWIVVGVIFFFIGMFAGKAHGISAFGRQVTREYAHSSIRIRGTILNGGGSPGAGVGVLVQVRNWRGGVTRIFGGTTDGRGRYNIRIPKGPSRLLTVIAQNTVREVRELVHPQISVSVRSHGHLALLFTGKVDVDNFPGLPTVILQDDTPSGWQTFGAVLPSPIDHRYRYVYSHADPGTAGHSFKFRAVTLQNSAWMPGYSSVRMGTVR